MILRAVIQTGLVNAVFGDDYQVDAGSRVKKRVFGSLSSPIIFLPSTNQEIVTMPVKVINSLEEFRDIVHLRHTLAFSQ